MMQESLQGIEQHPFHQDFKKLSEYSSPFPEQGNASNKREQKRERKSAIRNLKMVPIGEGVENLIQSEISSD